ncbi:hypothetical protein NA57DRAFT_78562 [Rhizodiscina lignyota]|uniref:P-loop containing nucleoside triphosphate hydrolase protein n=1 Tax=Rhizodiscina lignyota TaxID=1504668 RepID=A0A9P4I6A5_9PEZI|nr:hypothetical protein NA57DRAFT_78562 [Rhizodiscina lignyota]
MSSSAIRPVEMQVIGAGIGRTGTTSLSAALEILGISPTYNWAALEASSDYAIDFWVRQLNIKRSGKYQASDGICRNATVWDEILRDYAAIADAPGNEFATDLAHAYPNAKVILTVRDSPEAWLASWNKTIYAQQLTWRDSWSMRVMRAIDEFTGRESKTDRIMLAWYNDFQEHVHKNVPADRLLEYNVKEGWEPLCHFLGKEIPDVAFPHVNDAAAFHDGTENAMRKQQERLQWLVLGTCLFIVAPGALMLGSLTRFLGTALHLAMLSS